MEALTSTPVAQGAVVIIAVILILDRVVLLVKYARNGRNGNSKQAPEIFVSQPVREVLHEMFETQRSMKNSIDQSNEIHREQMGAFTGALKDLVKETRALTHEVAELKGKVS